MAQQYNDPAGGNPSSVGTQFRTDHYIKEALMEARELQYFMPLADVTSMPKNMGKKIKKYHYIPLLDDENINDQGIDAAGATISNVTYSVTFPRAVLAVPNASKAAAVTAIEDNVGSVITAVAGADGSGGTGLATITLSGGLVATYATNVKVNALETNSVAHTATRNGGNLYGSSKDIGTIPGKLPLLSETGGRVNRVGFKRKEIEGTFEKFGFFDEYTQESIDFDTDADLMKHVNREMINGAHELTEDALQIDLLNSAGVVRFAGAATQDSELDEDCEVDYNDLLRLHITLNDNLTPMKTKILSGTRMIDTKTIAGGRVLYCGSEMQPTLEGMEDLHGNPAFVPVHQYAAGTTLMNGEIGAVGHFRVVIVPKMLSWQEAGAVSTDATIAGEVNYNVYPLLCVGDGSFTTIGFQTDGKTVKFKIFHKAPGLETADRTDPYGETGFMSIKWYYGFLLQRPERIGLIKSVAKL